VYVLFAAPGTKMKFDRSLACSCSYHVFSLCQLSTLTIHNSLSLSLPSQGLHLSQMFPTIDSLPASGLTPWTGPFLLSVSLFMAALWNRAGHYIFILWFLSNYLSIFPRLISAAADWMSTILRHMVWP